jgi:hypothetical protein
MTEQDREAHRTRVEETLAMLDLLGRDAVRLSPPPSMKEAVRRLEGTDIKRIRQVRNKIAIVAEMGYFYLHARGADGFESMSSRILKASTESFTANMLLYAAAPISATLRSTAWHTMSALLVLILTDSDDDYSQALDKLSEAMAPELLVNMIAD